MRFRVAFAALILTALPALAQSQSQQSKPQQPATQPVPAAGAQSAPDQKIDPTKEADIRRLLDLIGANQRMKQMARMMMTELRPAFEQDFPAAQRNPKLVDIFLKKIETRMGSGEILELFVPLYDKYFTDDDIKEIIHFYESPLGQKYLRVTPQLTQETFEAASKLGKKMYDEIEKEMETEYPELKSEPAKP
jgi:hypothetical protein